MNTVLRTLLNYSKQDTLESGWKPVAKALTPIYAFTPAFYQVIDIVTTAYQEAINEPRFELRGETINNVLLAPIKGFQALESWGAPQINAEFTVEAFYTSILNHMISHLRVTRVDWCRDELTI